MAKVGTVRLDGGFADELRRCATIPWYFSRRYWKIVAKADREGKSRPVLFDPRPEQVRVREMKYRYRRVYNLKARQLGFSTEEGADKTEKCLFNEYWTHGVVAHSDDAANAIFNKVYVDPYNRLPEAIKKAFPLTRCNDGQMRFKNGSEIIVTSAESSGGFAGRTLTSVHYSEFARYKDPDKIFSDTVVSPNGYEYLETTAEGFNRAYDYWMEENRFFKVFMSWTQCPDYVSNERPRRRDEKVEAYAEKHGLTLEQKWWMYGEIGMGSQRDWNSFNQKYPVTPDVAFVSTGVRMLQKSWERPEVTYGILRKHVPERGRSYVMSTDASSGSAGSDPCAWAVLDVTDPERPKVCSTYYGRLKPREFAALAVEEGKLYGAVMNPLNNGGYDLTVIEYLREVGYPYLCRQKVVGRVAGGGEDSRIGYNTTGGARGLLISALQRFVDQPWFDVWDERLQSEINKFAMIDGKEQASPGGHDDLLMALGGALVAIDQRLTDEQVQMRNRPKTAQEIMDFYIANGRYADSGDTFDDDEESGWSTEENGAELGSVQDALAYATRW